MAYSPDGRIVLTSSDKTARLWDAASGKELHTLRHDGPVVAVAFSPDGRTALTVSADKTARLWDAASGKERATLRHEWPVRTVAFSPDGRTLLTGGGEDIKKGGVRLWDAATGREIAALRHGREVLAVAFSPDGRTALIFDGPVRLWKLPLPAPDEPARVRAWVRVRTGKCFEQGSLRDLTRAEWLEQCRQLEALGGDW
jgi:WD40 repeat protein